MLKTEHLVRRWNWLTGKDQFALARIVNIGGIIASSSIWFLGDNKSPFLFLMVSFIAIYMWYPMRKYRINEIEQIREKESREGKKYIETELKLETIRRRMLVFAFVCVAIFFITEICLNINQKIPNYSWFIAMTVFECTEVFITYLISVDKPPYSKSQVKDWLRSLVTSPIPMPAT